MILLVLDAQDSLVTKELYQYEVFVSNVKLLIAHARKNNVNIVYIRHDDGDELTKGATGFEIYHEFEPNANDKIFDKKFNSAFKETGLLEYLRLKKECQIMIVGLQSDYCIDATIKCGFEHGFDMIVPAFCNSTFDNEFLTAKQSYKYYNEKIWANRYAQCISLDAALEML